MNFEFNSRFLRFGLGNVNTDGYTQPMQTGDVNTGQTKIRLTGNRDEIEDWVSFSDNEGNIYRTTPEVQTVIKKGSELFSNGRWIVKDSKDDSIIENHPIMNLLETPNAYQNRNEFLQDLYIKRAIYGNSMTYLNYPLESSPLPVTMTNLDSNLLSIVRSGKILNQTDIDEIIKEYKLKLDNNDFQRFKPKEIIHLRMPNPSDPIMGLSPLGSLMMPISNIRAGRGYIYADYVKKGAHGAFSPVSKDGAGNLPFLESDRIEMEKQYAEMTHGSGQNQSTVLFLKKPAQWHSISSEIKNHLIHEEIDMSFKKIIDAYGLSDKLFSFLKEGTFNNQENGEMQAYQNHVIPFSESVGYAFNQRLKTIENGYYIELNYDHLPLMQEDDKVKAETLKVKIENYKSLVESGFSESEAKVLSELD